MKEKKKKQKGGCALLIISFFVGAIFGFAYTIWLEPYFEKFSMPLIFELVFLIFAYVFETVIHESGHLVFGLATGYRFSSFRVLGFMIMKADDGFKFKRLHIAGTGGQCLMAPPENREKPKFILYNLGGCIMNLLSSALALVLMLLFPEFPYLYAFCATLFAVGIIFALINGFPFATAEIQNDGCNTYTMIKDPKSVKAFWIQLDINRCLSEGKKITDMPNDWFFIPDEEEMKNSMFASIAVFRANRLLEEHKFEETKDAITALLEAESAMVGIHRKLLICDLIFLHILDGESALAEEKLTKDQISFMQAMKKFPSVIRTNYALALSKLGTDKKNTQDSCLALFEKTAKKYPYPAETEAERELMKIAKERIAG